MTRQSSILFQHSSKHLSAWQEIDAQFLLWSGLEYGLIWSLGILETCLQAAEFVNLSDNWASPALTQRTNSERCGKWTWGNFTRLRDQHAPVGLADGFYTMQAHTSVFWGHCGTHGHLPCQSDYLPFLEQRLLHQHSAALDPASCMRTGDRHCHSKMLWVPFFTKKDENISSAQEVFLPRDNNYKLSEGFGSLF